MDMFPIDKITAAEKDMITYWRYDCADENGNCNRDDFANTDHVLRFWNTAKGSYLFKLFGEELMITKKIKFTKSIEQIYEDLDDQLFCGCDPIGDVFCREFRKYFGYPAPWKTKDPLNVYEDCPDAERLVDYEHLATNIYHGDTLRIPTPDGKMVVVQDGSKVSKALKKLSEAYNIESYEEFRIKHSQILNDKCLEGELTISIHPMDFMTMSDNDCGWGSCMSWSNYGEYRMGTVEMMNSDCVLIAYLNASTPYRINSEYNWSNKKWRQLFIINEDIITGIKGYPYRNDDLTTMVCQMIKELAAKNLNWEYTNDIFKYDTGCANHNIELDRDIHINFDTCHMYNDFSRNQFAFVAKDIATHNCWNFSGEAECMVCGKDEYAIDLVDHDLACCDCGGHESMYCDHCGTRLHSEDNVYWVDDVPYCEYCVERSDNIHQCDQCGEYHHDDCLIEVRLTKDDKTVATLRLDSWCYDTYISKITDTVWWDIPDKWKGMSISIEEASQRILDIADFEDVDIYYDEIDRRKQTEKVEN